MSYDHVELNFFLNGKSLRSPITGIRGSVYPVFYGEGVCVCVHDNRMIRPYDRMHIGIAPHTHTILSHPECCSVCL